MINVLSERTYALSELARKLPTRKNRNTLTSWCKTGIKPTRLSPNRIRLEYVIVAGVMHSSLEAYQRWVEKLTEESRKYSIR